jgi:hypothetical protein
MGAPVGNQNAAKAKIWHAAIMRALERRKPADERIKAIDELADKLLDLVAAGDLPALKEFGDRMDGKPAQAIIGGGEDDPPIRFEKIKRVIVNANADDPNG